MPAGEELVNAVIGGAALAGSIAVSFAEKAESILTKAFGAGKGSGAALLFFVIGFAGIGVCLYFRRDKFIWELEK